MDATTTTTTTTTLPLMLNSSQDLTTKFVLNLTHVLNTSLLTDPSSPSSSSFFSSPTLTTTTPTLPPPPPLPLEVVHAKLLRAVYLWVLVGVGIPANTACVLTVLSMNQPPYYVAVLGVADSLALGLKLLFHQLVTHEALTPTACLLFYLPPFFGCLANWVLILISLERFVAVCFPFKKQELFSTKKIVASVVGLSLGLFLVFLPSFFFYGDVDPSGKKCAVVEKAREGVKEFKKEVWEGGLFGTLYFFLPFLLVTCLTALIIRRLQVIRLRRQRSQSGRRTNTAGPEHAVSVMLISASLIFLILVLPACLYHITLKYRFDPRVLQERATSYLLYQVVTVLSDATHAVNFFVYFLSAAKFRAAFADVLSRCCPGFVRCRRRKCGVSSYSGGGSKSVPLTRSGNRDSTTAAAKDTENCDTML